jgi:transcriptional regulator with XRE-family HTH domain
MGRTPSERPAKLAEKLVKIRKELNLSQAEVVYRLGLEDKLTREDISKYERGVRIPPLLILLKYARIANVWMDVLVDDGLDLPIRIPSLKRSEGLRSRINTRR